MDILKANIDHIDHLAPLFDGYRVFYKQASDIDAAKAFLTQRIQHQDSVIYIAYIEDVPVGFTQLYPLFSSVSMAPMYLLNDLYVHHDYRGKGIGEALINRAKDLCRSEDQKGLAIQTAADNPAQDLYERLGFVKDPDLHFFWTVD
ncbi:MAG: GNAT family N-acetyltransferase [Bacteroidota bacterium]